jgi:hypothetical protein
LHLKSLTLDLKKLKLFFIISQSKFTGRKKSRYPFG